MKSTEVDESLSTTTTTVLFQRKPTCFKMLGIVWEISKHSTSHLSKIFLYNTAKWNLYLWVQNKYVCKCNADQTMTDE